MTAPRLKHFLEWICYVGAALSWLAWLNGSGDSHGSFLFWVAGRVLRIERLAGEGA